MVCAFLYQLIKLNKMENTEKYEFDLREKWELISLSDFIENVSNPESFPDWLEKQEYDPTTSYLEISVKIKAR